MIEVLSPFQDLVSLSVLFNSTTIAVVTAVPLSVIAFLVFLLARHQQWQRHYDASLARARGQPPLHPLPSSFLRNSPQPPVPAVATDASLDEWPTHSGATSMASLDAMVRAYQAGERKEKQLRRSSKKRAAPIRRPAPKGVSSTSSSSLISQQQISSSSSSSDVAAAKHEGSPEKGTGIGARGRTSAKRVRFSLTPEATTSNAASEHDFQIAMRAFSGERVTFDNTST